MHGSNYHGVVDRMVTLLAERRAANRHREAYLSLARAIVNGESCGGDLMSAECDRDLQPSPQSTRAA